MDKRYFPIFVDPDGRKAVVIGGGNIAERRIKTLLMFDFEVTAAAPKVTETIAELASAGKIRLNMEEYSPCQIEGAFIVTACTSDRQVNQMIGENCREAGIPVSVCDAREESTFWFPAVAVNEEVTVGIVGNGETHDVTRKAASAVRKVIEERKY